MLILDTIAHETIWGGDKLKPYTNVHCKKLGHLYSLFCAEEDSNTILNGKYKGKRFNEYFNENKFRFGLGEHHLFPLIIALVEAKENLSIQVHPGDDSARLLLDEDRLGKNESWYFLDRPQDGFIYCGCDCDSLESVKDNILNGNIEAVTSHLAVDARDYVYVTSGTLHAMSRGSLVYEIEENAGATFRFYDFNRIDENGNKRELHIPQAFMSLDPHSRPGKRRYVGDTPIEEKKYITRHFDSLNQYTNKSDTLQILTVLNGEFECEGITCMKGKSIVMEPGEEIDCFGAEMMLAQPKVNI